MELLPAPRTFAYRIDDHDRITFFNEDWLEFARENDGAHLTPSNVWSRPIWEIHQRPGNAPPLPPDPEPGAERENDHRAYALRFADSAADC